MSKPGPKPKVIDTSWRPDLAYVVGVIASDGNLGRDGLYVDITSKDREMLKIILKILDMQHIKIGVKKSGDGNKAYRIQFKRALFHSWLQSIGLSPNKSKTLGLLKIPRRYFLDFLRGEWDGDGTIYCSRDLRWRNSHVVSMCFASGSIKYLEWLQKEINSRLNTRGHIHRGKKVLQLRYARKDSKKIFDSMFYQDNIPYLPRKFTKAQKIFRMTGL